MKFTLDWLRTHLDTDASLDAITDTLTRIGLELEGVEDPGEKLAGFRIAHVIEAVAHPNADRLRACTVDIGGGETVSVVCGAPNARTGMKAVFAAPGAYIPGTGITLKVGDIRGVRSAGMLLSLREMGLGDDHAGIVDLPDDAPVGVPYPVWAGLTDPVIEISVTPNRGDALSVRGVARDLAAAGLGTLKRWAPLPVPSHGESEIVWALDMPRACPWVLGRTVRGVRNGDSPDWLRRRLTAIGLRPISALVDITNFFTIDLGRPLHVFDVAKVSGDTLTLRPGAGEMFRGLHGRDVTVTEQDCVIADAAGVQSLAGVVGGAATGCDAGTTDVFIECALFDPVAVALSGRRHTIVSDARQRFERGIDPALLPDAIEAATRMVIDLCGGTASAVVSAGAEPAWPRDATLRFDRLGGLGGMDVPADAAVASLERLGFSVRARDGERVTVAVPSWRNDIASRTALDASPTLSPERLAAVSAGRDLIEPECDLIEEVLRLRGLDAVPPVSLPSVATIPPPSLSARQARSSLARRTLAAAGMLECVTFSFLAGAQAALFGEVPDTLRIANPIAADLDQLRPTPLAGLALAAARNAARGQAEMALFEVGPGFRGTAPDDQRVIAAGLRAGIPARHWSGSAPDPSAIGAKHDALSLLAAFGVPADSLSTTADAPGFYHPGRSGVIRQGPKTVLANFGALHPRVLAALDLIGPVVALEVFLDAIGDPKRRRKGPPDLPAFQPVRRDFAFVVDSAVAADRVLRAARGAERTLIDAVALFDVYTGPNVGAEQKSVAIEVTFQPRERTLTDDEIEAACANIVAAVTKATGGVLRG